VRFLVKYNKFLNEKRLGESPVAQVDNYNISMSKGVRDKIFFLDKVSPDCIVDFGSADGFMLSEIKKINPNINLIGYDIDDEMISKSMIKHPDIFVTNDWNVVMSKISKYKKPAVFLSSVIHEVYSYSTGKNINKFWNDIYSENFKWVIIRDMMPSKYFEKMNILDVNKIKQHSNPSYLKDFEEYWGDIGRDYRNLLHWLLKYKYTNNWERELKENYLPITLETLKEKIPPNWKIIYEDHYIYEYFKKLIKNDFGVELVDPTHLKMIIENESYKSK